MRFAQRTRNQGDYPGNQTVIGVIAKERRIARVRTNSRTIFFLGRASSPCSPIGFELVESAP
jgi:hypothetical protein